MAALIRYPTSKRIKYPISGKPLFTRKWAFLSKWSFKNDVTGVRGVGYPKVVIKSEIGGRRYIEIMTSPPKKIMYKFLFLVSAVLAEFLLAFRWWCCFKHWPESGRSGCVKPDLHLVKSLRIFLALKSSLVRRLGTGFIGL